MKTTYDPDVDAAYIYLAVGVPISDTREIFPGITIDLDAEGRLVGIELLDVMKLVAERGRQLRDWPRPGVG